MPGNILDVDTSFPNIQGKSQGEINRQVMDYLYMLLEQLRYSLANLGQSNFNDTEFDHIVTLIQDPVYMALDDTNGNVHRLSVTAEGLLSSVSDLNGNLSSLSQTVYGMRLEVSNGYSSSDITLTADGVGISSQTISFTGLVTFTDLEGEGTTTINGANIKTGTIRAIQIDGCDFTTTLLADGSVSGRFNFCYLDRANLAGGLRLDDQGEGSGTEGRYRLYLYTQNVDGKEFNLKIQSGARLSMEASELIFIDSTKDLSLRGVNINLQGEVRINQTGLADYIVDAMSETVEAINNQISDLAGQVEGLYNEGYTKGYSEGQTAGYSSGYSEGESAGYDSGYSDGYDAGYSDGESAGGGGEGG